MTPVNSAFPEFRTDRLLLNAFQAGDAEATRTMAADWEVARMTLNIPHPYEPGMAEQWISNNASQFLKGEHVAFALRMRSNGSLIGCVSLHWQSEKMAELGYWVGRPFWGQGYMSEAVPSVFTYGFRERGLEKIQGRHFSGNPASGRVMQKCGMKYEGFIRRETVSRGRLIDIAHYGILRGEWRRTQPEGRREAIILMGVSGSGKTTVGQRLAAELGGIFADADAFHPAANVKKMAAGHPLTDEDRWPWLQALQQYIAGRSRECPLVVACSALREAYREMLAPKGQEGVRFVHLEGSPQLIVSRLKARSGHFMPPGLLQSQFAALEPPSNALVADIDQPVESIVWEIMSKL